MILTSFTLNKLTSFSISFLLTIKTFVVLLAANQRRTFLTAKNATFLSVALSSVCFTAKNAKRLLAKIAAKKRMFPLTKLRRFVSTAYKKTTNI